MDSTFATYAVTLNGRTVLPRTRAAVVDGRVLLPLRPLAAALDAAVSYDSATHTVSIARGARTTRVGPHEGVVLSLGHAYAPLRAIADAFDYHVDYDGPSRTVALADAHAVDRAPAPAPADTPYAAYSPAGAATAGPEAFVTHAAASPLIASAYIDGWVRPDAHSFDVIVNGPPGLFGRVAVEGIGTAFPLVVDGATRYRAHVVVPAGTHVAFAHVYVRVESPGRGQVTTVLPQQLTLIAPPPTPAPSPTPKKTPLPRKPL